MGRGWLSRVGGFLSVSHGDKARLLASVVLLILVWVGIAVRPFAGVRAALHQVVRTARPVVPGRPSPGRVVWAVDAADRHCPGDRTCLVRSLTSEALLRLYGYEPTHRIGVDKEAEDDLAAHSWLEYEGDVLIGDLDDLSRYEPLPALDDWDDP